MNQQPDMYYQPQHMSAGPAPAPQTVTSSALPQYGHQQPTLLQPGPLQPGPQYSAPPYHYSSYPNGLTSPQTAPPAVSAPMGPGNVLPLPGVPNQPAMQNQYQGFDTTGQIAPPGMKPRVTATLWEDEGSLCFQVEARGICVARREDNHMINGTKLLNVAGMTRGRRDGILKSEKVRHVVKIGPMHLKGVWIPFERALDFANKEKITELLYPLFVHNIGALLYHPTNQNRTNQVMAAAERRKQEVSQMRNGPAPGPGPVSGPSPPGGVLPSLQQHQHHHHMGLPGPQPLPSHGSSGRPSIDRAHTFPTPPTSASSVMGNMGAADNYWGQPGMNGAQGTNSMSIDTNLSNAARSMPATPATTPPGNTLHSMQSYPQATQPYDNGRGVYSHTAQQASYSSHNSPPDRNVYGQPNTYMKSEMGPPSGRPVGTGVPEGPDVKPPNGMTQHGDAVSHPTGEDEAEHEAEYTHDSGAYDANRTTYNYNASAVAPMSGDHSHLSSEIASSPGHQAHSGRATPRTAAPPQPYYGQPTGYNTPPRVPPPSSSLYSVMSNDRGAANGASASDVYGSQTDINPSLQNGYAPPPVLNGVPGPLKRGRDDEDDLQRPPSGGLDLKRRKTLVDGAIPTPGYDTMNRPASAVGGARRR
ncbi:apses-domain-containing protein [Xylaria curta]|nr:apses-domain-containing protein [Xylaria curta]